MNSIIEVTNLSKSYGVLEVIKNVSFKVYEGETVGLLGENGAGKTTTVECILGTERFDSGKVKILGLDPSKNRKELFERVGVQFQESGYQSNIKVEELCQQARSLYKKSADYAKLLEKFGLLEKRKTYVEKLSGGQVQRLFIVLALISNPEVLFLDELTTGLDILAREDVWSYLESIKTKTTILMTSHYLDEIKQLCDRILVLDKGKIAFNGTVLDCIKASPYETFEDAYLWYIKKGRVK